MVWLLVLALGLVAGTIGGLIGFGSTILLMPALVTAFGAQDAVPIMTIAGLAANLSRVVVWWREVDWQAAGVYAAGAVPGAALGARTFVALDPWSIQIAIGLFLLATIPARRWLQAQGFRVRLWQLAIVGAVLGYLSGIITTIGPVNTPFFLAYGLVKGAFVSTEALGSLLIGVTKAGVFRAFGVLPTETLIKGLLVGATVAAGSMLAKRLMPYLMVDRFRGLMDVVLAVSATILLVGALV
jgi:uncharacterized protein